MASVAKRKWTHAGQQREAWVVRYVDQTGSRRSRQFDQKKPADAFKREVERELGTGQHVARSQTVTLAQLSEDYMRSQEALKRDGRIAEGTWRKERFYFESHIKPRLGSILLTDLSKSHIDQFIRSLGEVGARPGKGLKPSSVKQVTQALARAVDFGVRRQVIAVNLVREVGQWPEHRRGRNEPIRTFTREEVQHLLVSIETRRNGQRDRAMALSRAMIYLAAFCGLRLGEVMGLTWRCVDLVGQQLEVRHSLDAWDNLKSPKTRAGYRTVPMPAVVTAALEDWRQFSEPDPRDLLFRTSTGGRLTTAGFHRNYWQPALKAAGLGPGDVGRRFHYHALRHFAASMMVECIPLADTAQLLGHKSFDMTLQVYAHPVVALEHRRKAMEGMTSSIAPVGARVTQGQLTS